MHRSSQTIMVFAGPFEAHKGLMPAACLEAGSVCTALQCFQSLEGHHCRSLAWAEKREVYLLELSFSGDLLQCFWHQVAAKMAVYGVQTQIVVEDDVMEYEAAVPATSWRAVAPSVKSHSFAMIHDGPRPSRGICLEGARIGAMAQPVDSTGSHLVCELYVFGF